MLFKLFELQFFVMWLETFFFYKTFLSSLNKNALFTMSITVIESYEEYLRAIFSIHQQRYHWNVWAVYRRHTQLRNASICRVHFWKSVETSTRTLCGCHLRFAASLTLNSGYSGNIHRILKINTCGDNSRHENVFFLRIVIITVKIAWAASRFQIESPPYGPSQMTDGSRTYEYCEVDRYSNSYLYLHASLASPGIPTRYLLARRNICIRVYFCLQLKYIIVYIRAVCCATHTYARHIYP